MGASRRDFLKAAAGVTAVGLGATRLIVLEAEATGKSHAPSLEGDGPRWAMAIDTQKCAERGDCSACTDACHSVHNVPDFGGSDEEIKWIWKEPVATTFPHHVSEYSDPKLLERRVPVLCNHCENPPCVRVCPTQATFKRDDGIVMMDQHRCIGCRYCIVGCPYGARSFNFQDPRPHIKKVHPQYPTRRRGVVEKCTFCAERLAKGQEPACVEASKATCGALTFGDLADPHSEISHLVRETLMAQRKSELGTRPKVHYKL